MQLAPGPAFSPSATRDETPDRSRPYRPDDRRSGTEDARRNDAPDRPQRDAPERTRNTPERNRTERGREPAGEEFREHLVERDPRQPTDTPATAPPLATAALQAVAPLIDLSIEELPVELRLLRPGQTDEQDPLLALAGELLHLPLIAPGQETATAGLEGTATASPHSQQMTDGTTTPVDQQSSSAQGSVTQEDRTSTVDPAQLTTAGTQQDGNGRAAPESASAELTEDPALVGKARPEGPAEATRPDRHQMQQQAQVVEGLAQQARQEVERVQAPASTIPVGSAGAGSADAVSLLGTEQQTGDMQARGLRPAAAAGPAAAQTAAGPADRAIAGQVARSVLAELPNGDRVLQLRLTPPELGTVRVQIVEHQGQLQVRMSAEDDGVRHALERALPQLRQDLRSHDAPVADLQLADSPFFDLRHQDAQQQGSGHEGKNHGGAAFSLDGMPDDDERTTPALGGTVNASAVDATA
ncbi:MAG: flagellar hook-length control protein FliK [Planctomycetota bacterium]